jgi:hypothetical protein
MPESPPTAGVGHNSDDPKKNGTRPDPTPASTAGSEPPGEAA